MALYLSEADVGRLIDMPAAVAAIEAAHRDHASGLASDVPRHRTRAGSAMLHLMQGSFPARNVMGYKSYTTSAADARFWLHLFDTRTGEPLAVIEADLLGMMRTGAAGAVAARRLARADSRCVGVIGAGWQARGQILGLAGLSGIERFQVFARQTDKLRAFCADLAAETGREIVPVASVVAAAEGADILVTVTTASEPVLMAGALRPGMHVNAVGSNALTRRELDEKAVLQADLVCVDSVATALKEAGDLFPVLEKGRLSVRSLVELGDLLLGRHPGRTSEQQLTLFESQGLAIQDLALGAEILTRARAAGLGIALPY